MNNTNPKHNFKKPAPQIISSRKSTATAVSVKQVTQPMVSTAKQSSNQTPHKTGISSPVVELSRPGQPSGAGVYQKPQPEVLSKEPKKYIPEDADVLFEEPDPLKFPKIIKVSLLAIFLILILFVLNQFTSLFVMLSKSPIWYQYIGYFFLGLLLLLLIYSLFSFAKFLIRLNSFDQQSLSELSNRRLTVESSESMQEIKTKLKTFVDEYDIKPQQFSVTEVAALSQVKQQLLTNEYGDSLAWLEDYKNNFQNSLDMKANELVVGYAKKVGWNTAIIPNGHLDSIVVFYMNLEMVKSLSALYNIRVGKWDSVKLLSKIFIQTFGARHLEEMTDTMFETASDHIFQGASNIFTVKLGSKVSEGVINYYFTRRIGKKCIQYLQPLTK